MKNLFAFTSTNTEPFLGLFRNGLSETWLRDIDLPDTYIRVLGSPQNFASIWTTMFTFFEKSRWTKFGRLYTAMARVVFKPLSFLHPKVFLRSNELTVNIPDCLTLMGFKMLAAIEYAIERDFDFLILTNSSSYLNTDKIRNYLESIDHAVKYYGGKSLPHTDVRGASGSFVILSRASMVEIFNNRSWWIHALLDDVALMKLMHKLKIEFTELPSIDVKTLPAARNIHSNQLTDNFHIKCGPSFINGKRIDDQIMREVRSKII